MLRLSSRFAALIGIIGLVVTSATANAQSRGGGIVSPMTRPQLMERARVADSLGRHEEAFVLRTRLREGDFEVGDVVIATYEGMALKQRDSLVVQAGKVLQLGAPMGDLNLTGVLRFELEDSVRARVDRYFKSEVVRVVPLVRLSISGAAKNPGFYHVRSDMPLSDIIMRGGGQAQSGTLDNITIKRGDKVLWTNADVQTALSEGLTIEALDLQPGDDIVVGQTSSKPWLTVLQYTAPVVTAFVLNYFLRRR